MSGAKFTPGPWKVTATGSVMSASGVVVALVERGNWRTGLHVDECGGNGRLIAKAPEMFALLSQFDHSLQSSGGPSFETIDALLAEIRGDES